MIVYLNGKFVDEKEAKISVFDHGFLYGDAIYETLKIEDNKIVNYDLHYKRFLVSTEKIKLQFEMNKLELEKLIIETVSRNGFNNSRVRVTVSRGENGFNFSSTKKITICIMSQALVEPELQYKRGVRVVCFDGERSLPEIKSNNMLPVILARQFMEKKEVFEALMIDRDGYVREGTISNFYMIKKGVLITPDEKILKGTMRAAVLEKAKEIMKVQLRNIKKDEIYVADECFLSNAPRGIVPIVKIDGKKIGNGKIGEVTEHLMSF